MAKLALGTGTGFQRALVALIQVKRLIAVRVNLPKSKSILLGAGRRHACASVAFLHSRRTAGTPHVGGRLAVARARWPRRGGRVSTIAKVLQKRSDRASHHVVSTQGEMRCAQNDASILEKQTHVTLNEGHVHAWLQNMVVACSVSWLRFCGDTL